MDNSNKITLYSQNIFSEINRHESKRNYLLPVLSLCISLSFLTKEWSWNILVSLWYHGPHLCWDAGWYEQLLPKHFLLLKKMALQHLILFLQFLYRKISMWTFKLGVISISILLLISGQKKREKHWQHVLNECSVTLSCLSCCLLQVSESIVMTEQKEKNHQKLQQFSRPFIWK